LSAFLRFPGLPQRTKAFHVLANRDGFLLYIRHRPDAFFLRQMLSGDGSPDFLVTIFLVRICRRKKPAQSVDRAGTWPFQYIREMTLTA
jgi:hypothetical protein